MQRPYDLVFKFAFSTHGSVQKGCILKNCPSNKRSENPMDLGIFRGTPWHTIPTVPTRASTPPPPLRHVAPAAVGLCTSWWHPAPNTRWRPSSPQYRWRTWYRGWDMNHVLTSYSVIIHHITICIYM